MLQLSGWAKLEQFAGVAGEIAVYLVEVCALGSFLFQLGWAWLAKT